MLEMDNLSENFNCPICMEYCRDAVECSECHNLFCDACTKSLNDKKCPLCRKDSQYDASHFVRRIINTLPGQCDYCKQEMKIGDLENHKLNCSLASKDESENGQIAWKTSDNVSFFFKSDDNIWLEKKGEIIFATFDFIAEDNDGIILFDKTRDMFVKLTSTAALWGNSLQEINKRFSYGHPLNKEDIINDDKPLAWKKSDAPNTYFYCFRNNIWIEKEDSEMVNSFEQLESDDEDDNEVVLYDESRDMYVKLTPECALWGDERNNINSLFSYGKWMKSYCMITSD